MRRALILTAACALVLAAALAPPALAADGPQSPLAPADACATPADAAPPAQLTFDLGAVGEAAALAAAGLGEIEALAGTPPCPTPRTCGNGGPYVACISTNCSTTDTGYSACTLGEKTFACISGTIHVTSCNCQRLARPCCSSFPACVCGFCNSSSNSISCQ